MRSWWARREHLRQFAGELSGHYYFKQNFTAESQGLAVVMLANLLAKSGKKIHELVEPLRKYFASGEINSKVSGDPKAIIAEIKERYKDGHIYELDGVTVEFPDWWCNVRCSNTEPLLRLIVEAHTQELMVSRRDELLGIIRK